MTPRGAAGDGPAGGTAPAGASAASAPAPRCTHLLYLHGFRSSPLSTKARLFGDWIARHRPDVTWHCPQLPPSPAEAMRGLLDHVAGWPPASTGVVGSSLGGFYATAVAERLPDCRAVVLNPAVHPARDLAKHIGEQAGWHDESQRFTFTAAHVAELRALEGGALTRPQRYLAVVAKGDEVLDWREMAARYAGCRLTLLEGGDHALSGFEALLPEVAGFLGLA